MKIFFNIVLCSLMSLNLSAVDCCNTVPETLAQNISDQLTECCTKLTDSLTTISKALPCKNFTAISSLPFIISTSGNYCITQELLSNASATAALIVTESNVLIDFQNHSITQTGTIPTVIQINPNLSNIVIQNPVIHLNSNTARGIDVAGSTGLEVRDIVINNPFIDGISTETGPLVGIQLASAINALIINPQLHGLLVGITTELGSDITIMGGHISNPVIFQNVETGGIDIQGSRNVTVSDMRINTGSFGLRVQDTTNFLLNNSFVQAIAKGFAVDKTSQGCTIAKSSISTTSAAGIGVTVEGTDSVNNLSIIDSIIENNQTTGIVYGANTTNTIILNSTIRKNGIPINATGAGNSLLRDSNVYLNGAPIAGTPTQFNNVLFSNP